MDKELITVTDEIKTDTASKAKMLSDKFISDCAREMSRDDFEVIKRIFNEYTEKLLENGFGHTYEQIQNMNFIDARPLFPRHGYAFSAMPNIKITNEEYEFSKQNEFFYSIIPCFEEGVIQINRDRYIYWKILDIQPHCKKLTVKIEDYEVSTDSDWWCGIHSCLNISVRDDNGTETYSISFNTDYKNERNAPFSVIYNLLDLKKELHWHTRERELWKKYIRRHAETNDKVYEDNNLSACVIFGDLFIKIMTKINYYLSQNKPSRPTGLKRTAKGARKEIITEQNNVPERFTRKVGRLTVNSEKPPKAPTEATIVKYKIPSWTTRGYIRRYKTGKVTYVKPSVHHRKCLHNDNAESKTTILFDENILNE